MSAITNIFGRDGFFWWIGVVEDRNDPEKLGRCRVRILGYHIDNKETLPTTGLPWAMPMQPITSAALSGKGSSPVGPLEGTWVMGFFVDGADKQQPMMLGTIGGMPVPTTGCAGQAEQEKTSGNDTLKTTDGQPVTDGSGNPIKVTPQTNTENSNNTPSSTVNPAITGTLPPLTAAEIQTLMDAIGNKESSSTPGGAQNYATVNTLGYTGKYQFGAAALVTLGYMVPPASGVATQADMINDSLWAAASKNNIKSVADWKKNGAVQEAAMFELLSRNYKTLINRSVISPSSSRGEVAGYLWVAHNLGAGSAAELKAGRSKKDAYGTGAAQVYALGAALFGESETPQTAGADNNTRSNANQPNPKSANLNQPLNDPKLGQPKAFSDPNSVYPKCDYTDRPDTNKLATGDTTGTLIQNKINNASVDIATANSSRTWSEPEPAYCARYPYNHVIETESGHVIEMDDTPGKERLHVYHRSGTYIEIDSNGTFVQHVQGDNYQVYTRNNQVYVHGRSNVTIEGPSTILSKDALDIEVWGATNINIKNDANINVSGAAKLSVAGDLRARAKNIFMEADNNLHLKAGGSVYAQAGSTMNIKSSGAMGLDGSTIDFNDGVAAAATATGLATPELAKSPGGETLDFLTRPDCSAEAENSYNNDDGDDPKKREKEIAAGRTDPADAAKSDAKAARGCKRSSTDAPKIVAPQSYKIGEFAGFKEYPYSIQLSRSWTLGALANCGNSSAADNRAFWNDSSKTSFNGFTKSQLLDNLRGLCINVLDPIKAKYPSMQLTSCMRFSVPPGGSQTSQHMKGQAVDFVLNGSGQAAMYDCALWIRDNVAYDQLLLEYKTFGGVWKCWIHVSFNPTGARGVEASGKPKVATMVDDSINKRYLCDLSQ